MSQFLFLVGKNTDLCDLELDWLAAQRGYKATPFAQQIRQIDGISDQIANQIAEQSGGIVKVAKIIATDQDPASIISNRLAESPTKPVFSVIAPGQHISNNQIKDALKAKDINSRFMPTRDIYETATGLKTNYQEFWVLKNETARVVAEVIWIQNIRHWAIRDYNRPKSDPKSGMLPPKIARILVNLAIKSPNPGVIYDPFCGSGTILAEAATLGHQVIGSDISQKAIEDTNQNLAWLAQKINLNLKAQVFVKDVAHVSEVDLSSHPDAIVFEPYMGPPNIKPDKIKDIAKGLEKLYIGAIKNLAKIQQKGERLVCILPMIKIGSVVKTTDSFIDRRENFGYTLQAGPLEYSRPHAIVIRRIYVLERM